MTPFRLDIRSHVAETIRHLPPDLKPGIKAGMRVLSRNPRAGEPLRREMTGWWKYRVRRFRIIYGIDEAGRTLQIIAVGHRRSIYEEAAALRRRP